MKQPAKYGEIKNEQETDLFNQTESIRGNNEKSQNSTAKSSSGNYQNYGKEK